MPTKTFMKITNKNIYDLIIELKTTNTKDHGEIVNHQINTNGKVKTNKWIATTAITISLMAIGFCLSIL